MASRFNLIDEPWIPLRTLNGGVLEAGLRDTLCRAQEYEALAESSPPNLVALHRLLLSLLSRCLAEEVWQPATWWRNGLPVVAIESYLDRWRDRFWVFHETHPFMQAQVLAAAEETRDKRKPWTQLALDRASGDAPLLFDHTLDTDPPYGATGMVMRCLLGLLQFTPGGLIKVFKDSDKSGPLANTAAVIPTGKTLHQTLLLSLHDPKVDGLPAWEKEPPALSQLAAGETLPDGRSDLYTRLTRSVLLIPEDQDGRIVRWVRFGAGLALGANPAKPEPMAAYVQGKTSRYPLAFREGRAFWRELPSLVPDPGSQQDLFPRILDDARGLLEEVDDEEQVFNVTVSGLSSDRAKLLRWSTVSFQLPRMLLSGTSNASAKLRKLLNDAEDTGSQLIKLAYSAVGVAFPTAAKNKELPRSLPTSQVYYAHLETRVPSVLSLLAEDSFDEASVVWTRAQIEAARKAWDAVRLALGNSLPVVCAMAKVGQRFGGLIAKLKMQLPETEPA